MTARLDSKPEYIYQNKELEKFSNAANAEKANKNALSLEAILKLSKEEMFLYLYQAENWQELCLELLPLCNAMEDEKYQQALLNILDVLYKYAENGNIIEETWNKLIENLTFAQGIYFLRDDKVKSSDIATIELLEAILSKQGTSQLVDSFETERLGIFLRLLCDASTDEDLIKNLKNIFVRELAKQKKLAPILKQCEKDDITKELIEALNLEEMKECVNFYILHEDENNKPSIDGKTTLLTHFFYVLFNALCLPRNGDLDYLLQNEKSANFFICLESLLKEYPAQICQAFHGIILALGDEIVEYQSKVSYKELGKFIQQAIFLIDQILEKYPQVSEKLRQYFSDYPEALFKMKPIMHLDLLRIVLAIREHKHFTEAQIDWLSRLVYSLNPRYNWLPIIFFYLDFTEQKALIKVLFEKCQNPLANSGTYSSSYFLQILKNIVLNLLEEEPRSRLELHHL